MTAGQTLRRLLLLVSITAYIVYVGAVLAREMVDPSRLEPCGYQATLTWRVLGRSVLSTGALTMRFGCTPIPRLLVRPLLPRHPPPDPPARARGQSPPGTARSTISPFSLFRAPAHSEFGAAQSRMRGSRRTASESTRSLSVHVAIADPGRGNGKHEGSVHVGQRRGQHW